MSESLSRRDLLAKAPLAAGAAALAVGLPSPASAEQSSKPSPKPAFRYCLNTSTIRGQKLSLPDEIDLAAEAGYDGIEPWIREIDAYAADGSSLDDLRKRIADRGLAVESAIGFAEWLVDDDARRAKGLEQAKRDMDLVRQIGGGRVAAPPAGAYGDPLPDLLVAAERYRALLELGERMEVVPQLEFWGGAKSLYRLAQCAFVAVECGHPRACLLPDVYHIFRGGSDFSGLKLIAGGAIHVFHLNDYPGDVPREQQNDGHRVYPGDGVAPLGEMFRTLHANGFRGALSLELFNRDYWEQDALQVARTGLEKMRETVARSLR